MKTKIKRLGQLFFPLALGGIVSIIIKNKIDYEFLIKPPFAPPKLAFPIAWSIIYLLMGISYYKINKNSDISKREMVVYYSQLIVNALWSIIFFVFKLRLIAVLWIILLDILVIWMITLFYKKDKASAYLNIPYLLWILFATYLTTGIYVLN